MFAALMEFQQRPQCFNALWTVCLRTFRTVQLFLDNIIVTGATEEDNLANLDKVLTKLEESGLRLNQNKCVFFASEVIYLGHKINAAGL